MIYILRNHFAFHHTHLFIGNLRYTLSISKYGNRERSLVQTAINSKGLLSSRDESEIDSIKKR